MVYGSVIRLSDPKSCIEESEIGAKTGVEAEVEAKEEDTTGGKTVDEIATEEIRRVTERRRWRRERR